MDDFYGAVQSLENIRDVRELTAHIVVAASRPAARAAG